MLGQYFKSIYQDTMQRAYDTAYVHISQSIDSNSNFLDCGASNGWTFDHIAKRCRVMPSQYYGIEWDESFVKYGQKRGLNIVLGDLNKGLPYDTGTFSCVYALSILEHLLNPCRLLKDCHRVLSSGGRLVLLTPNISTYFTAFFILLGKMPSSGPHPDSDELIQREVIFQVSDAQGTDATEDKPIYRHLIVFSYRVLRRYLHMLGFSKVSGYGFGLYPFPIFMQRALEQVDPFHCHQMVFVATKY